MKNLLLKNWLNYFLLLLLLLSVLHSPDSYAATAGNMPFVSATQRFKDNFFAWLTIAAIIMMSATMLLMAFREWGAGIEKVLNIIFWLSLALAVPSTFMYLFGASGATF